ncbi:MAG: nicotinate-nicotinamide nucleotide adenylyltransferase [Phycisphaerales bacterium]
MTHAEPTPLPVPVDCPHVVLFGGTFDPPHVAHVSLADLGRQKLQDRIGARAFLVFVPAARSPHKDDAPTATDAQRVEMLRLATHDLPDCTIWTDELDRANEGEPSYWVRTLARAASLLADRTLWFMIGADQAVSFHRWRDARRMLELAHPLVLPRHPISTAAHLRTAMANASFWSEGELDRWTASLIDVDLIRAASTTVRKAQGSSVDTPMHPSVLEFVRRHGLYGRT